MTLLRTGFYVFLAIVGGFLLPYLVLEGLGLAEIRNPQQQLINAVWRGSIYSLFALGYALVFSIMGLLNLAHSSLFMWGGFIGLMAVTEAQQPLWVALPAGMLGAGIGGILLDLAAFKPLRKRDAPRSSQLISSIGAAAVMVNIAIIAFGALPQRFPPESLAELPINAVQADRYEIFGATVLITPIQIFVFITSLMLMFGLQLFVGYTRYGKAMRLVAYSPQIAALMGVRTERIFQVTFFWGGVLAGAGGVLYGLAFNSMTPFMGTNLALIGLTVLVLGGLGGIQGAVVGGFLVANIEILSISAGYSWLSDAMVFSLLFVTLLVRPQGLLGQVKLDKV